MTNKTLIAVLLATATSPAFAQQATPSGGLDEIIVTATRRAESAQDITTAVTAFTAEDLEKSALSTTIELQQRTPGLVFSTNGSFGQPYIRGIGSDIISPGADAPVAIYIDGAYQARPTSAVSDFFDVERVEVLKGPQGALYGRNATGGALAILTRDPESEFGGDVYVQYGSYNRRQVKAALNTPITEDLAFRVSGMMTKRDGYIDNTFSGKELDDEDLWGVRAKVKYAPTDDFSLTLTGEFTEEDSTRNGALKLITAPGLPAPVIDFAGLFGYAAPTVPPDERTVRFDFQPRIFLEQTRFNAKIDWDLGFADLQSVTAYTKVENVGDFDLDGTEIGYAYDREDDESRTISQLVQLTGRLESMRLDWLVGADYFNEEAAQNFDARLPFFSPPSSIPLGPNSPIAGIIWDSSLDTSAWSAFVDLRWDMTDQLRLVASGRYSHESKEADFLQTIIDPFGLLTGGVAPLFGGTLRIPAQPDDSWSQFTPRLALEFRPREDMLLYVSATNGFKSGGFNLLNNAETFEPEKLWSYEAGIKADWLDGRLRTNAVAFFYDYTDLQVIRFDGLANNVSNADAEIKGLEIDIQAQPTDALTLTLGAALLDASYTNYLTINSNFPALGTVNLDGNRMPKSPETTLTSAVDYVWELGDAGRLSARGEARYVSEVFFDQFETAALAEDAYTLFNARLAYTTSDDKWTLAAFGRNLTDETYIQSMVRVDAFFGTLASYGAPQTFGVEARLNF